VPLEPESNRGPRYIPIVPRVIEGYRIRLIDIEQSNHPSSLAEGDLISYNSPDYMVERFLNFIHREWQGLHEVAILLAASALVSQLLGLWRDRVLAGRFGAGHELDIYYAAFRIPDLLYVSLASFVSVTVVLPFILGPLARGDRATAERLLGGLLTSFLVVSSIFVGLIFFLLPFFQPLIAPGFDGDAAIQLTTLARILLLSPILLGLSNLFANVTQAYRQFFVYALSPIFYNLGIIIGIEFFEPKLGLSGLALGVALGAFLHLAIQIPTIIRSRFRIRWPTRSIWREVKQVIIISLPRTLTLSTNQLTLMILVAVGSLMSVGSIAVFTFAFNLQSVPLAIIGVSYSAAAFPTLVRHHTNGDRDKFIEQITRAARHILFWSLPATALFIVLRAQVVRVILGSGHFDWGDTRLTAASLAIFIFSLVAQSLVLLFVRGYYASGKTRTPLLINVGAAGLTIVLAFVIRVLFRTFPIIDQAFAQLFRVSAVTGVEILALPLAFAFGSLVSLGAFWYCFERDFGRFSIAVRRSVVEIVTTSFIVALVAYAGLQLFARSFDLDTFWGIFGQGFLAGIVALIVGGVILHLSKNHELAELQRALRQKFWRQVGVVLPEASEL